MDDLHIHSCRLCLKSILSESYVVVKEAVREVLDVILPNLNLNGGTGGSVYLMCDVCLKKLLTAFQFKATCLYTEDKIFPYLNDSKTQLLDLIDIYAKEKGTQQLFGTSLGLKICRLCMEPVKRNFETIPERDFHMIQKFLPEMNFLAVKYPIVCQECHESLGIHTEFLEDCLRLEKQITNFSRDESSECFLKNGDIDFKCEENFDKEMTVDDGYIEMTEKKEQIAYLFREQSFKFVLKNEEVDIKCEENLYEEMPVDHKSNEITEVEETDRKSYYFVEDRNMCKALSKSEVSNPGVPLRIDQRVDKDVSYTQKSGEDISSTNKSGKGTKYKKHLLTHQFVHKDLVEGKMYKCGECKFETKYKRTLKNHHLRHKDPSEVQMYKCGECKFETRYKDNIKSHLLSHKDPSEVQMYKCAECRYEAKRKKQLKQHQLKHKDPSEVQMYKCNECDYISTRRDHLKRHLVMHKDSSAVQMYRCNDCDYKSTRRDHLKRHQVTHKDPTELQVYRCNECDYTNIRKYVLKRHQMTHKDLSEVKTYRCDKCDYISLRKYNFKQHLTTHKSP